MRLTRTRPPVMVLVGVVCAALFAVARQAPAATVTYPSGGSGFSESAEGWSSSGTSCAPAELLCTSEAVYDPTAGNPPGSIAVRTTVTLNLGSLFKGTATWESPQFKVPVDAITGADVHLDHAFDPGGLVDVGPEASYVVKLADLSTGTSTTALSEEIDGEEKAFAAASGSVAVVGGHTYKLSIETETAQSTLALSLVSGTTNLRFDNVGLTVRSSAGGGGGGKGGGKKRSNSLSDRRLFSLLNSGASTGPAVLKGKQLLVKVNCPAKVGRACRIAAQGMLTKRKPATRSRVVKLGKGKSKRVALAVKPKARKKLAKRKRLLVRQKVRAGGAQATVYKVRKLISG